MFCSNKVVCGAAKHCVEDEGKKRKQRERGEKGKWRVASGEWRVDPSQTPKQKANTRKQNHKRKRKKWTRLRASALPLLLLNSLYQQYPLPLITTLTLLQSTHTKKTHRFSSLHRLIGKFPVGAAISKFIWLYLCIVDFKSVI